MSTNNENTTGYLKLINVFYDNVMIEIEMINKKSKKNVSSLGSDEKKLYLHKLVSVFLITLTKSSIQT